MQIPKLILIFLAVDWPIFSRRPMLKALAESAKRDGATVVAINRPLCPLSTAFRKPQRFRELFKPPALISLADNLYLYSPKYVLHDKIAGRIPTAEFLNVLALRRSLKSLQQRLTLDEPAPIVWYYYPRQGYVSRLFQDSMSIYEVYDGLSDVLGNYDGRVLCDEAHWRRHVDLLLATSPALLKRYGAGYRNARLLKNGISRAAYQSLSSNTPGSVDLLAGIPYPRLGYAGAGFERLDWNLILKMSDARQDWSFVFAGRVTQSRFVDLMATRSNIHYLGEYSQEQIAQVVGQFDIGLLPYLDNEFFRYLNPLKIYEHCAAGIPSVSSPIEILTRLPKEVVTVCRNDAGEWIPAIEAALRNRSAATQAVCREFAGKHVWEDITDDLMASLRALSQSQLTGDGN